MRNRKQQGKSTFVAFLDAEKVFDNIDRDIMLYKLLCYGFSGHLYDSEATCSVIVNNKLRDWFASESGVKQGDVLFHTLFNIFIIDLAKDVKAVNLGVPLDYFSVSILLYADDIALVSDSEI